MEFIQKQLVWSLTIRPLQGIAQKIEGNWILTVEGNVDNRVLSKRRYLLTVHAFSNWLD